MEVDRLSELPDDLIHQILSLLNIKARVRTRILSKRWRDLFSSFPTIDYCFNSIPTIHNTLSRNRRQTHIDIVDGLLRLSKSTHLRLLHLDFFIGNDDPPFPDQWLGFVAGLSSVADLVVCFRGTGVWSVNTDRFRSAVLSLNRTLSTVRSLTLDGFKPSGFPYADGCYLGSLKSLSLRNVGISDEDFASMLKLCPPLESIRVFYIGRFSLSGRDACRLETLDVCVSGDVEIGPALRLRVFRLKVYRGTLSMKGVPALREATLSMYSPSKLKSKSKDPSFQFDEAGLSSLKSIESLTIDHRVLKVIRDRDVHCSFGLFDNVKRLHLNVLNDKKETSYHSVIASLRYFPHVEKLWIQCLGWRYSSKYITCAIDGYYQLNHLKMIELMNFYPTGEAEMQLFKFLLRSTVILEKFHLPSNQSVQILKHIDDLDFECFPGLLNDVKCLNLSAGSNDEPIDDTIISRIRHLQHLKELTHFPVKYLVNIDFEHFPGLFDNIKSLDLHLSHSVKITNDTIAAGLQHFRHLEELSIRDYYVSKNIPIIGGIEGYCPLNHLKTIKVKKFCPQEAVVQLLKFLLGSAVVLERLHISLYAGHTGDIFKYINDFDFERFPGMFDDVKLLNLLIPSPSVELTNGTIAAGLRHFRHLEKLSILFIGGDNKGNGSRSCAIDGCYALNHLKEIKIKDFSGREEEIQLVEFLLGNAVVLEKFYVVGPRYTCLKAEHVNQAYHRISLLCRASRDARLVFSKFY